MKTFKYHPVSGNTPVFEVPVSKSVYNRWLVISALFPDRIRLIAEAEAKDSRLLHKALFSKNPVIDVGAAGTAMRFATAFFASQKDIVVEIRGSDRMHDRPIAPLVDVLRGLGARIDYLGKSGYPPLLIHGAKLSGGRATVESGLSSQFLSALMLIAPAMEQELILVTSGDAVSRPYIDLTAHILQTTGIQCDVGREIRISGAPAGDLQIQPEGDWSAAVAAVAWTAVSGKPVSVSGLAADSTQGDATRLQSILTDLGVSGTWTSGRWDLKRVKMPVTPFESDFIDNPDLAQSLILAALGQNRSGQATGLQTLRIKETDRISALADTICSLGGRCQTGHDWITWEATEIHPPKGALKTYDDHRMAMAIAPLVSQFPITLDDPDVVDKSFPAFWVTMHKLGIAAL